MKHKELEMELEPHKASPAAHKAELPAALASLDIAAFVAAAFADIATDLAAKHNFAFVTDMFAADIAADDNNLAAILLYFHIALADDRQIQIPTYHKDADNDLWCCTTKLALQKTMQR